jgi:hypothetical protein
MESGFNKSKNILNNEKQSDRKTSSDFPHYENSNNIISTERDIYNKSNLSKKSNLTLDIENYKSNVSHMTPKSKSKKFGFGFDFFSDKTNENICENDIVDYDIKETVQNNESEGTTSRQIKIEDNLDNIINKSSSDISIYEGRYCMECHIDIPLRCKHCTDCGWCVATFDHHCSWTARCIGEKNKAVFLIYLFFKLNYLCLDFVFLLINFTSIIECSSLIKYIELNFVNLILSSLNGLFIIFVFTLFKFQLKLVFINQTTWENYSWHKIQYMVATTKSRKSPFDKGILKNISYVFCYSKVLKSKDYNYIVWKKEVELERFGN